MSLPTRLLVVGGEQRSDAHFTPEWNAFRRALVVRLDLATGDVETVADYVSPPQVCPDHKPSVVFKAGSLRGDRLFVPTQTEILVYRLPALALTGTISLPWFNDLHHVRATADGDLLVAITGLDLVARLSSEGEVRALWNVLGEDPWARFDPEVDYRKVATTKPHRAHPNYVFELTSEIWATRFEQRDAVCLTRPGGRIAIDVERPHDGVVHDGRVYFTTVDGHVVVVDAATGAVARIVDLHAATGGNRALGWCRGLLVVDQRRVIVGFSRLRPSRFRENVRWVRHRFGSRAAAGNLPTRVALYDLEAGRLCWQHELERAGLNALFSIHAEGRDDP